MSDAPELRREFYRCPATKRGKQCARSEYHREPHLALLPGKKEGDAPKRLEWVR